MTLANERRALDSMAGSSMALMAPSYTQSYAASMASDYPAYDYDTMANPGMMSPFAAQRGGLNAQ